MNRIREIGLTAVVLVIGACKDVPTFPGSETQTSDAAVESAMDVASAQTVIEDRLAAVGDTTLRRRPADTTRTRPADPTRRPDSVRTLPADPQRHPDAERAKLAVALGHHAVDLAGRLLKEHGSDEEQRRLYQSAEEQQRKAETALAEGHLDLAIQLAEAASQTALKAVVLPGGITDAEARMIHDVAADLLAKAQSAVGGDRSEFERHLLKVAEELFREGTEKLKDPHDASRGVVPLWKAATIASFLIG